MSRGNTDMMIESLEDRRLLSTTLATLNVVHAKTAGVIEPLTAGITLDLTALGPISIIANPSTTVGSVLFTLDGKLVQTQNLAPYDINNDNSGQPIAWAPALGAHTLTVTPYTASNGKGTAGKASTVKFNVTASTVPTGISNWATVAPSPTERAEAVGGVIGSKVYVFGGFENNYQSTSVFPLQARSDVYDPSTNTWTRLGDMPEPFTHAQEVVVGTDMWFIGGFLGNSPGPGTTHVWIYHSLTDTWTRGPDLPQARGAGAAVLLDGTIYFTGGMNQDRTVTTESNTWALNLSNLSAGWVTKANSPNGRNHVAGAALDGYFYEIGGQHGQIETQAAQNEVDRYDPSTNTWTKVASLPSTAGNSHITEGTLVYEGRIIVIGGETGSGDQQRTIESYNPATNDWTSFGLLPAARSTVIAGIINGKLVVTTGNGPGAETTTWIATLK